MLATSAIEFPAAYGARKTPVSIHDRVDDDLADEMRSRLARASLAKDVDSAELTDKLVRLCHAHGVITTPLPTSPKTQIPALATVELFWPGWLRREVIGPAIEALRSNNPEPLTQD